MKLKDALISNKDNNVKVGCKDGTNFVWCGKGSDMDFYHDREVVDMYPSIYGGNIIIIEGDENGKYWTVEECQGIQPEPIDARSLDDEACKELANAIYENSVESLIHLMVSKREGNPKDAEEYERQIQIQINFLTSGMYMYDADFGEGIVNKVRQEIDIAYEFVDEFYHSGEDRVFINPQMTSIKVVKNILGVRYFNAESMGKKVEMKLKKRKEKFILERIKEDEDDI